MIDRHTLENGGFLLFLTVITLLLALVVSSFATALLWSTLAAILFQPLFHWFLARERGRRNLAAGSTLLVILFAVIVPALIIGALVVEQAAALYTRVNTGQIDFARYFGQVHDALPTWIRGLVDQYGFDTFERVQSRISQAFSNSFRTIAGKAVLIGRNAASFVLMFGIGLYVSFFLLRDGDVMGPRICAALPLDRVTTQRLVDKFLSVVRATVKGSLVVGLAQGALGALTFWIVGVPSALLWGLLMAFTSLLPAIGTAIVWGPVALFLLATGDIWQGIVVILSGVFAVGMVDNILRPILVGRDTGLPDWIVLVSTLGGIEVMGLGGIVVGPVVAALFLAAWQLLTEQRLLQSGAPAPGAPLAGDTADAAGLAHAEGSAIATGDVATTTAIPLATSVRAQSQAQSQG